MEDLNESLLQRPISSFPSAWAFLVLFGSMTGSCAGTVLLSVSQRISLGSTTLVLGFALESLAFLAYPINLQNFATHVVVVVWSGTGCVASMLVSIIVDGGLPSVKVLIGLLVNVISVILVLG